MAAKKVPAKKMAAPKPAPKKTGSAVGKAAGNAIKKNDKAPTSSGPTFNGKPVNWDKSKTWKPTEAFVNPGQKPTGLGKSTPSGKSNLSDWHPGRKSGVESQKAYDALEWVGKQTTIGALSFLSGSAASAGISAGGKYLAGKTAGIVADAAMQAGSKGLGAAGAGGKIRTVMTPMGKTLGSTNIGTAAQQAARMNNLAINASKNALVAGNIVGNQVLRGINTAGKVIGFGTGAATEIAGNILGKKKKKK